VFFTIFISHSESDNLFLPDHDFHGRISCVLSAEKFPENLQIENAFFFVLLLLLLFCCCCCCYFAKIRSLCLSPNSTNLLGTAIILNNKRRKTQIYSTTFVMMGIVRPVNDTGLTIVIHGK